jgi:hypothetical protein
MWQAGFEPEFVEISLSDAYTQRSSPQQERSGAILSMTHFMCSDDKPTCSSVVSKIWLIEVRIMCNLHIQVDYRGPTELDSNPCLTMHLDSKHIFGQQEIQTEFVWQSFRHQALQALTIFPFLYKWKFCF